MSEAAMERVGPCTLSRCVGAGGDGAVFEGVDTRTGQEVAVKVLNAGEDGPSRRARFERAAALWGKLNHPNICRLLEVGVSDKGIPYITMELVRGRGLDRLIALEAPMAPMRAVRLVRQILLALRAAHREGVLHRDIKPSNILVHDAVWEAGRLVAPERVKVVDFGLARSTPTGNAPAGSPITVTGQVLGTPSYMAPEQVDHHTVREGSDVYSVGLVFYELLTGSRAVQGETTWQILLKQLEPRPVIDANDPAVPSLLRPVLMRSVEKDIQKRFPSAEAFLEALDAACRDADLADEPPRPPSEREEDWTSAPTPDANTVREALLPTVEANVESLSRSEASAPRLPSPRLGVSAPPTQDPELLRATHREGGSGVRRARPIDQAVTVDELPDRPMIGAAKGGAQGSAVASRGAGSSWGRRAALLAVPLVLVLVVTFVALRMGGVYGTHPADASVVSALQEAGWVSDDAGDGLVGYWGPAAEPSRGVLLVLHGVEARPEELAAELEGVRKQGVSVYVLAHRGYGASAGDADVAGFVAEAELALGRVAALSGRPEEEVALLGRGLGGATAASVAARRRVGALVLDGVEPDIGGRVASQLFGLPLGGLYGGGPEAGEALSKVSAPVLMFHGSADARVPLEEARGLFERVEASARKLDVVEGGGHEGLREKMGAQRYDVKVALFVTSRR